MITRSAAAVLLVVATTAAGAQPAPPSQYHARVTNVVWANNSGTMYSTNNPTLTIQLPAASTLPATSNILANLRLSFDVSMGRYHVMIPVTSNKPNILTCFEVPAGNIPQGSSHRTTMCSVKPEDAKAITQDQTISVSVGTPQGTRNLTLIVKPYTGPNYVAAATVTTTNNQPNGLITFRVRLMSPASQSQTVAWGLSPASCFLQDSPGTTYNSGWTLNQPNQVTFNPGDQQRDLTVRVANLKGCAGTNRKLEVWSPATTSVAQPPTYTATYFNITLP
jgi:hypothetical protein